MDIEVSHHEPGVADPGGPSLQELGDRVAADGGTLRFVGPADGASRVQVSLPCG